MSPDRPAAIPAEEIEQRLAALGLEWTYEDGELVKVTQLADFAAALGFVNAVGDLAEAMDHHPDIDIRWNTVTLHLVTHSAGGITTLDFDLAGKIDQV